MAKIDQVQVEVKPEYDRQSELKDFDETKAGVKGLVDAGIQQVPRIFHHPLDQLEKKNSALQVEVSIPVIDLEGVKKDPVTRQEIVEKVRNASKTWGFFQVVNHGIPVSVLEDMKDGARRFFEQDLEVKKQFFTRDYYGKGVIYNSNFDLFTSQAANWRDTLFTTLAPNPPSPDELPEVSSQNSLWVQPNTPMADSSRCFCKTILVASKFFMKINGSIYPQLLEP
ncbi:hypothetical protein COLO4_15842 [Corchorus olitorius]|uniref:Non-haem dioxygenase N-terminal domain-containing protein n=1 Tax=Corchorus olitorius TaxID=93759 RepID=A0A1R3JKV3_9ROSI|nr:hypothetical protein COLO4_15842 [Corchorus olitorius]